MIFGSKVARLAPDKKKTKRKRDSVRWCGMLIIKKIKFGISYDYIWFAERPSLKKALGRVIYMQCLSSGPEIGFLCKPFFYEDR